MARQKPQTVEPEAPPSSRVQELLARVSEHKLRAEIGKYFFGPDSIYLQAVECDRDAGKLIPRLRDIWSEVVASEDSRTVTNDCWDRWNLIQELTKIRVSQQYDIAKTIAAFDKLGENEGDFFQLSDGDNELFKQHLNKLSASTTNVQQPEKWKRSHYQLLDFLTDWKEKQPPPQKESTPPPPLKERTPLLFVNNYGGNIYFLVAELKQGGPLGGMVYPDWWKLGLMHLGNENALLTSVTKAFRSVMKDYPNSRMRFRWWLERHDPKSPWFKLLGECDSIQVAAACLAKALCEEPRQDVRPLLDETVALLDESVAVSATLGDELPQAPEAGGGVERKNIDYLIGPIGGAGEKKAAALTSKLSGVVFASEQHETDGPYPNSEPPFVVIQSAPTLALAYDDLLITSKAIKEYNECLLRVWDNKWWEKRMGDGVAPGLPYELWTPS